MIRLFVRHRVADYDAWRRVYDEFDTTRRPMGVLGEAVFQAIDDPRDVTLWHDFDTADEAQAFASSEAVRERPSPGPACGNVTRARAVRMCAWHGQ